MSFSLTTRERNSLEALLAKTKNARHVKRAQALLAVAEGEPVIEVARRLNVLVQREMEFSLRGVSG
jgi:hypothetical protein